MYLVLKKNLHFEDKQSFKNCFNFQYISSYKNWFKNINLTWPKSRIRASADQWSAQSEPQTFTGVTEYLNLHDRHRSALLPSHCGHLCSGLCFLFCLLCSCSGHRAQCCVSTQQCRSVSSIYLRVDGLAHGNTGTLQCILLHTKVTALVERHKRHKPTQKHSFT